MNPACRTSPPPGDVRLAGRTHCVLTARTLASRRRGRVALLTRGHPGRADEANGGSQNGMDPRDHLLRASGHAWRPVAAEGPLDHVHRGLVYSALLAHRCATATTRGPNVRVRGMCPGPGRAAVSRDHRNTVRCKRVVQPARLVGRWPRRLDLAGQSFLTGYGRGRNRPRVCRRSGPSCGNSGGKRRPDPHGHGSLRPSFSTSSVSVPTTR